jgi:Bacterial PH domain
MTWKHFSWISRELPIWILTAAVLISLWGDADKQRKARARQDGRIEFTPNRRSFWAWTLLVAYLIYATINQLMHIQGRALNLMVAVSLGILTVMIAFRFPGKIIVTADGLEQVSWLWRNKQIRWAEIGEINTGGKSRTVTITGADGTRIVHSRQLPDRQRLLMELKQHCGENLPPDFPQEPIAEF